MNLQGRALYNLIRLNYIEDPTIAVQPWQIENLRELEEGELFKRLKTFDIDLSKKNFTQYAENVDSPEQLAETLWIKEEEDSHFDQVYLVLFELWRRLLPHQQSLSIFCDELDHLCYLYDNEKLQNEETLQTALDELENLLDENVDKGLDPKEIFAEVNSYCSHDLETFIYDYAADLIDRGQTLYASELIDGFAEYVSDQKWIEFLRAALVFETDEKESMIMFGRLLDHLQEEPEIDLLFEVGRFLVKRGSPNLFLQVMEQVRPQLSTEEDFQELLILCCDFSRLLEREEISKKLERLLNERKGNDLSTHIAPNDPAISRCFEQLKELRI